MIIKSIDPKQKEIAALTTLLQQAETPNQKFLIEREIRSLKAGIFGEEDAAYYINFYFGNSKYWAVIHDLRIEHDGSVAQIDHILINRLFQVYVIESKNFSYEIVINDNGEFALKSDSRLFGIPSPVEQNNRHLFLLKKFVASNNIAPRRLGIPIIPQYKSLILMSPKSVITRPDKKKFDTDCVIKADTLRTKIDKNADKITPIEDLFLLGNISSLKSVTDFAEKLQSFHSKSSINYHKKFGIQTTADDPIQTVIEKCNGTSAQSENKYYCFKCNKKIQSNVASFCWNNR
ncbi:MAG: nuclease-related domain-containing protein, partial [Desulfomicrobium sp.]|nr:nuclease-related domain-containing protein [Desulfomicrobium sp.]